MDSPRLYPILLFGHFGYIDGAGRVVVDPTLSWAKEFRYGLGVVQIDDRWGYVDREGRFAIAPRFDAADDFSCDFAVAGSDGKKGVIDRHGAWVIDPLWERIDQEGDFWRVQKEEDGPAGWLASNGAELIAPRWTTILGGARTTIVIVDADGPGVLDLRTGHIVRLPAEEVGQPGRDTIPARVGDRWGWLDLKGRWVLPPAWGYTEMFVGDRARVRRDLGEFGLIDRSGRLILQTTYRSIWSLPTGGWIVQDERGVWYVDDYGRPISGPWKDSLVTGTTRVLLVEGDAGWGAIELDGRLLIEPTHQRLADAGEGLLAIRRDGLWGYVDPRSPSPLVVAPRFERVGHFHGGLAAVDEGRAYVDRQGREVWSRPPSRPPQLGVRALRPPDWAAVRARLPKLAAAPTRVFGAKDGHEFTLGPRLTEDEIRALEAKHRVALPVEFRAFLLDVGNGPAAHTRRASGGAGPGHGLYEIARALADAPLAHRPFVPPRSRAEWEAAKERDEESIPPGLVVIGTHGCAWDYGIVVTGPWAGTMWSYVDPGWIPDATAWSEVLHAHHDDQARAEEWLWEHVDELQVAMFADVYMGWFEWACGLGYF